MSSFYPYSIETNKCSGSCNVVMIKVFNLMLRSNETRYIEWHVTCKGRYRLDVSVCNDKQRWHKDQCRCEYKELIDIGRCDKEFIWNPSSFECECDKLRDIEQYLDYNNCKCRKELISKLVEECSENIEGNKMIYNATLNG